MASGDEELLGQKPKKVRPPYLTDLRKSLSSVIVLYEGKHKPISDLRKEFDYRMDMRRAGSDIDFDKGPAL